MKKLYKSRQDKVIDGVCGGLGEYFGVDPVVVRIVFVILTLWGGAGIILYILGMLLIPEATSSEKKEKKMVENTEKPIAEEVSEKVKKAAEETLKETEKNLKKARGSQIFGVILIFLGLFFMLETFFPWFDLGRFWWAVLIILGLWLLFKD